MSRTRHNRFRCCRDVSWTTIESQLVQLIPPPSLPTNRLSPRYDTEAVYRTPGVDSSSVQLDFTNV